jgi:hypothetical protein
MLCIGRIFGREPLGEVDGISMAGAVPGKMTGYEMSMDIEETGGGAWNNEWLYWMRYRK